MAIKQHTKKPTAIFRRIVRAQRGALFSHLCSSKSHQTSHYIPAKAREHERPFNFHVVFGRLILWLFVGYFERARTTSIVAAASWSCRCALPVATAVPIVAVATRPRGRAQVFFRYVLCACVRARFAPAMRCASKSLIRPLVSADGGDERQHSARRNGVEHIARQQLCGGGAALLDAMCAMEHAMAIMTCGPRRQRRGCFAGLRVRTRVCVVQISREARFRCCCWCRCCCKVLTLCSRRCLCGGRTHAL